jgi:hypothetical protein
MLYISLASLVQAALMLRHEISKKVILRECFGILLDCRAQESSIRRRGMRSDSGAHVRTLPTQAFLRDLMSREKVPSQIYQDVSNDTLLTLESGKFPVTQEVSMANLPQVHTTRPMKADAVKWVNSNLAARVKLPHVDRSSADDNNLESKRYLA